MDMATEKPKLRRKKASDGDQPKEIRAGVVINTETGYRRVRKTTKRRTESANRPIADEAGFDAVAARLERREQQQQEDAIAQERTAGPLRKIARQMRRGHRASSKPLETPTPHRGVKAGELRADATGAYHCDSVLATLASRGVIAKNPAANQALFEAGERYLSHWTLGYRIGVAAQNINREGRAGFTPGAMSTTESATVHAQEYRRASQHLGPFFSAVVDPVVLCEEPLESVGRRISGYKSSKQATAVAMDRLREGLSRLAALWRMTPLDRGAPNQPRSGHDLEMRPPGKPPSRALRYHRSFSGM